ncbi:periplasmic-type flagellar collar protein FlbB [Spirochaeta thermophila]|uniref:Flagellar protein FlbB n=1 Tax=Winmispira thermophila (strain ATCC 49972 / DSM 6192 / RI 19.B1) TaxID=665571 RepID=E0RS75_WINT6|nr:hypothetical protein [Spirochaeta thermophila]ADN01862.1 hypothetical protein STHERM_c09150 [Spirochaeta thermophila DSM 6192]
MPENYTRVGPGLRIFALVFLIVLLLLGGGLWLTYLGVIDVREQLSPLLDLIGVKRPQPAAALPGITLLESARIEKEREALKLKEAELEEWERRLGEREAELESMWEELQEKQKALEEQQKSFNEQMKQYENKRAIVRQTAQYLINMPPDRAVEILLNMEDDQDVIDILWMVDEIAAETGEDSIVPYWLSLMPADRAARLQRKMVRRP